MTKYNVSYGQISRARDVIPECGLFLSTGQSTMIELKDTVKVLEKFRALNKPHGSHEPIEMKR